tara:strand:+ start:439 stop:660 length:222 start_codon:yes stop_codon:yes gene_type:complete
MKPGNLVRYKAWPHEELHNSGMVGIVLSEPYAQKTWGNVQVDVWWDRPRSPAWGNHDVCWEFFDELEVVNAVD